MDLRDLTPDEDAVLLGFLDEVVSSDGEYSDSERAHTTRLETAIGKERVAAAIADVNRRFPSRGPLEMAAKGVSRPEAREAIYKFLEKIAAKTDPSLVWLATTWSITR